MDGDWFNAVLEEYRSLRAEAVTARDAQLSILRLALPLLAALVGVGVSLKSDDQLLAGLLLGIAVPIIVALTFELWLGQVQRSLRAGSVVAAIEQRLADLFGGEGGGPGGPPMGWEQWLRWQDNRRRPFNLSRQQWESTSSSVVTFGFLLVVAIGSFALGLLFLIDLSDATAVGFAIGAGVLNLIYLVSRSIIAIGGLQREKIPKTEEVWPREGGWNKQS